MAFDYSLFQIESSETYHVIWDNELTYSENIINLINQSVLLPNAKIQVPIIASYILIPSALAKILPILFCYGAENTGKSTIGKIASYIHGVDIESSTTTFAGLKNALTQRKYYDGDLNKERNTILIFDDIDAKLFIEKPDLYRMFKCGYDRATDTIEVSSNTIGTNLKFKTFCPKIFSSYQPLHLSTAFPELQRRMLVINFKKIENFTNNELIESLSYQQPNYDKSHPKFEKLDIDSIEWKGLSSKFLEHWENYDRCYQYMTLRKDLASAKKRYKPDCIESHQWLISIDLLCSGIVSGIWKNTTEAIENITNFWMVVKAKKNADTSATVKLLYDFIEAEIAQAKKVNNELGYEAIKEKIEPKKLKKFIQKCIDNGELDISPKISTIVDIMRQLGWKLDKDGWIRIK